MIEKYISPLIKLFEKAKNADKAVQMENYMKDLFPFLGIPSPERKELIREFLKEHGKPEGFDVLKVADYLWQLPFREYQYAGIAFIDKFKKKYDVDEIKLLEKLTVTKSWWDTVDGIAANFAGKYFLQHPDKLDVIESWSNSKDMWLNRTAILFQLMYKTKTDTDRLIKIIEQHKSSKEFFIKKGIGWALREYSKTDAEFVKGYVANSEISNFSKTEALKWLKKRNMA